MPKLSIATKNIHLLSIPFWLFLGFLAAFISIVLGYSISASASTSATTGASPVSVTLENLMALRVLDKTATSVIDSISMDLDPTPNGSFTKNSMMVEVSTRNSSGYTLYLTSAGQGYTNSELAYTNALVFMDGESPSTTVSDKIPSLPAGTAQSPTSITEAEYSVRNSLYRNTWGYSTNSYTITQTEDSSANLEASNGTGVINTITENTNPTAITYTDIPEHSINKTVKQTDSTAVLDLTPITVGVNSTSTNAAGTYQNTLEFTATGNAIPANYSLSFNKNGYDSGNTGSTTPEGITESTISGMPSTNPMTATSVATSYTFTLPSAEPETSFSSYVFKEWNTSPDGTGTSYAPGSTFTVTADDSDPSSTSKTLYAIWEYNPFGIKYMQDMTSTICNSVSTPTSKEIVDVPEAILVDYRGRDGTGTAENPATGSNIQKYKVRKLYDGNCWMAENLQLNLTTTHSYKVGTFSGDEIDWTPNTSNYLDAYDSAVTYNYKENIAVTDYRGISHNNWYYTWYGATAGEGTQSNLSKVTKSICPKGWMLPGTNSSTKSFRDLLIQKYTNLNSQTKINDDPLNFYPTGYYAHGSFNNATSGYYWSSVSHSSDSRYAHILYFSPNLATADFANTSYKYESRAIRCVSI